jgi:hypothetical protein
MRPPALILQEAAERALRRAQDSPVFAEHNAAELRDAYRRVLLRQGERPVIVAVCVHCGDAIRAEDVAVQTARGHAHGRCINGPFPTREGAGR